MHNTLRTGTDPLIFISELTWFERENMKYSQEKSNTMVEQQEERTLLDFAMLGLDGTRQSVARTTINANNFEIKPALLQMIQSSVQFYGLANEDSNAHIANFLEICDTFKYNRVMDDAIRLRLFPFTLKDRAKAWLNS